MTQASFPAPRRLFVPVVIAQLAFGLLAMTLCLPSLQDWPAQFGATQGEVQLTFSAYVLAYGALQLVYGPLSDRLGRRPVLLFGLGLATLASVLAALAPTLPLLIAARLLQGAGCAAGMVIGRALVQDLFEGPARTRMMAWVGMTMGLVPPAAALLGGQIHVALGWRANFALLAMLAVLLWVGVWRLVPRTPGRAQAATGVGGSPSLVEGAVAVTPRPSAAAGWTHLLAGYGQLARVRAFPLYVLITACTTATFYVYMAGAPLVLAGYGVTPGRVGWFIMWPPLAYILGNLITSRWISRLGERRLMWLGQATVTTGILLVLAFALAGMRGPWWLAIPLVLMGIGHGLLVPPALAGTVGLLPALAGSAAAVAGVSQQLAGALAGWLVGLVPHQGAVNLAMMMLAWTLTGVAAQWLLARQRRKD